MRKLRWLGILKQSAVMSVQNIKSNKMRSFLTTLGIIIGVMAVIALVTIVQSVQTEVLNQFSEMGAGVLSVSAYGTPLKNGLSENDLEDIAALDNVKGIAPSISLTISASAGGEVVENVSVEGKNEVYFRNNDVIAYGRPLYAPDMDGDVNVCIADSDFCENLFLGENPIGKTVNLGGITYKIVGLSSSGDDIMSDMLRSSDGGSVIVPYKNAMSMSGVNVISSLQVYVDNTDFTDQVVDDLEALLDNVFNDADNSYWIMNFDSLLEMMDTMMGMLRGLLAGIASISLLVGGIGIMNMMLVSVTERTKEIGLRKALGAEPARIQAQFLIEAVFLSIIGGFIGLILGLVISVIAAYAMDITFYLSVSAIILGVGFSVLVGIIFGWAPARKASRLNPIDALRSE